MAPTEGCISGIGSNRTDHHRDGPAIPQTEALPGAGRRSPGLTSGEVGCPLRSTAKPISNGWREKRRRALALSDVKPSDVTWTVRGHEATVRADRHRHLKRLQHLQRLRQNSFELAQRRDPASRRAGDLPFSIACCGGCARHHDLLDARDRSRCVAGSRDGEGRAPRPAQDAGLRPLPRSRPRAEIALPRLVRAGASHRRIGRAVLRRRFADMPWSILTPDVCAHWDGHAVAITPGISKQEMPAEDRLEETWRRHCAGIFNPARLKALSSDCRGVSRKIRPASRTNSCDLGKICFYNL